MPRLPTRNPHNQNNQNNDKMAFQLCTRLLRLPTTLRAATPTLPSLTQSPPPRQTSSILSHKTTRQFTTTGPRPATMMQVLRGCRVEQRARKPTSPQLRNRPEMKGVCVRVGITKPKKPNSGERKVARVRLSNGKVVTAYIPGEGLSFSCSCHYFVCVAWEVGREKIGRLGWAGEDWNV